MDKIEDVYSNDVYYPFILYCQSHNYENMIDLKRCSFTDAAINSNISSILLNRIKSVWMAYCKKHPDLFMGTQKPAAPKKSAIVRSTILYSELEEKLEAYFQSNSDSLIRLTDIIKASGAKRNDILKVLEQVSWCKSVDGTTFFYSAN